jgi:FAD/FMN-containing dehydrogenase
MAEKDLVKIVGRRNVITRSEILKEYSGDSNSTPNKYPEYVVRPGNADEIAEIVKCANETGTPLVPVSSGAPHFRGDTVPGADGAVIVDLNRMNKIIRIDTRNKLAMIEPGVTFGKLQEALKTDGLSAYLPLLPRATKSVVGSLLEREPITMPAHHWDSTDPLLCVEVVFGTGDRFRTGEASGPDPVEKQWELGKVQMNPFGHSHVDFQRLLLGAQGTIGIVTWATIKCRCISTTRCALFVVSESLEPLIDFIYRPLKYRLGGNLFIMNRLNLACLLENTGRRIQELKEKLPPWILFVSFEGYGIFPEGKVAFEEADFSDMASAAGLKALPAIAGKSADEVANLLDRPSQAPYWKTRFEGAFQDIFFLTTLDKSPLFNSMMDELSRRTAFPPENIGMYIQPVVHGTSCHCEFNLYYNPADAARSAGVASLIDTSVPEIAARGGFFSRPYPAWKDAAYRHHESTAAMQKKIKQIFDPAGVLNPGKLCF